MFQESKDVGTKRQANNGVTVVCFLPRSHMPQQAVERLFPGLLADGTVSYMFLTQQHMCSNEMSFTLEGTDSTSHLTFGDMYFPDRRMVFESFETCL